MINKAQIFALTSALAVSSAHAIENLEIYGFASIAAGQTFEEEDLPNGEKSIFGPSDRTIYTHETRFRPESTIGIQVDADLHDGIKLKTLLQADGEKDFDAEMKWAFAQIDLGDSSAQFQMGRQPLPLFYYTDFVDVAYSYQWIRPPIETYYIKNSTFDGAQIKWEPTVGDFEYRFQLYTGRDEEESDLTLTLNDITGAVAYMRKDWFEARATYMTANIETDEVAINPGTGAPVVSQVETKTEYHGVALKASSKSAFITGEWAKDNEADPIQEFAFLEGTEAWYVSAGYGVDDFVPYVTYAESVNSYSADSPLLTEEAEVKSTSWTGGIRWDFHSNAAFKLEYTSRKDKSSDAIVAIAGKVKEVDALSASIDLVF